LDAKQAKKIGEELAKLDNYYKQNANVSYDMGQYADAAYFFSKAFDVASNPAYVGQKDGSLIYNAGYLYAADGQRDPKSYEKAVACLNKALAMGYADEKGDIYYFLYVCYANLTDSPVRSANMEHAKQLLMEGLAKHPDNSSIVEGLIDIYTSEESGNNPADLIELVDKAVERDPQNVGLWFGRGRVFYAMENLDEAIASFKKVTELNPNDAMTWYYLGYFYSRKGDNANEAYYQRDYTSYEEANKDMAAIVEIYKEALPYLEKAHELDPEYFDTIQLLKELTFRLRDEEGIMEKYNKYNELYKQKAQ
jgi:tetratricopeptide (TPR) repeat protein